MNVPKYNPEILMVGEKLSQQIQDILKDPGKSEFHLMAKTAQMMLSSSATNDFYEKLGAEAIGFKHLDAKLGPDGVRESDNQFLEVKPRKDTVSSGTLGVINDDSAMKLKKDHTGCQWLSVLRLSKDGSKVLWALAAPFHYWEPARFAQIVIRLGLDTDPTWKWGTKFPEQAEEQVQCLDDLEKRHKKNTYVRSNDLNVKVAEMIPKEEVSFWVHPSVQKESLHPVLKRFL